MIGNVTSGSNFKGLCEYALDKDGAEIIGGNMMGETSSELAEEFTILARLRIEVKKPVWHVSLSAHPGEVLDDSRWNDLTRDYLRYMGVSLVNHQYVVIRHDDRTHAHVHSIVNRIGFNTKIYHNQWDRLKTMQACLMLEKVYGLKQTTRRERTLERDFERAI